MRTKAVFVSIAALLAASAASGQYIESVITFPDTMGGASSIEALLYDSINNTVYVGAENIIVLDGATDRKIARIPVEALRLGFDPTDNKVYALGGESLHVIDAQTNAVIRSLPCGYYDDQEPSLAYCPVGNKMYYLAPDLGGIGVIDCSSDSLAGTIPVSDPYFPLALVYNPVRNKLYCADIGEEVHVIDCATDSVIKVMVLEGHYPGYRPICYDPDDDRIYCLGNGAYVIDCATDSVIKRVGDYSYWDCLYNPVQHSVYCLNDWSIERIDCASDSVVKTIWLPDRRDALGLSYNPVSNKLYCGSYRNSVFVVDCATDSIVAEARVVYIGARNRFCCNTRDNKVYCAHGEEGRVSVIDGVTNEVTAIVPTTHHKPGEPLYVPARDRVYCVDGLAGSILVIDGERNRLLGTRLVGVSPDGLEYCSQGGKVYCADYVVGGLSVIGGDSDTVIGRIPDPRLGRPLSYLAGTGRLYCRCGDSALAAIDAGADTVLRTIAIGHSFDVLLADPVRNRLLAAHQRGDTITVVDALRDSVAAEIVIGAPSKGYGFSPTQNRLYCFGMQGGVSVVDCSTYQVVGHIATPLGAYSTWWNPVSDKLYNAVGGFCFTIIDCRSNSVAAYLQVGEGASSVAFDTISNRVYCPCRNLLPVADGVGDTVVASLPVSGSGELAWNPAYRRMYVISSESTITVVRDTTTGIEEGVWSVTGAQKPQPTIVRKVLMLGIVDSRQNTGYRGELLDAAGRRVLSLRPGANDVSGLAPGVYFVREHSAISRQHSEVRKVIVMR
jgi:YVTN family beta-propeller protein